MPRDIETVVHIIRIFLMITALCTTAFPLLYLFSPWYRSNLGRAVMIQSVSVAVAIDVSVVRIFWIPEWNLTAILLVNAGTLAFISVASLYLTWMLFLYNFKPNKERPQMSNVTVPVDGFKKPLISNELYDRLKWVAQIGLPAFGALYFALAPLWVLPNPDKVVGTVVAVDTFLGIVLGLATKNYNASDAPVDGVMAITTNGDGKLFQLQLHSDPEELEQKDTVVFKVSPPE